MKRKLLFPAALMLAVTLCFGLAACGEEEVAFSLKDFPAETTETAELGSVYSLKTDVEAADGATYRLSAEVLTKDGGAVAVFDNRFDVTDVSGYTITYTVVTTRDVPQSVVTLNVTDNTAPEIAINKPDAGVLKEEYCLPAFTVTDLAESGPDVTVVLNFVNGAEKEEISLTKREGRYYFKPEKLGSYEFAVTASKSNGKSRTATRTFVVDQPVLEGEVFSPEVLDPASQIGWRRPLPACPPHRGSRKFPRRNKQPFVRSALHGASEIPDFPGRHTSGVTLALKQHVKADGAI